MDWSQFKFLPKTKAVLVQWPIHLPNNWVFSKWFSLNSATNNNLKDSIGWPPVYQANIFEWFLRVSQWTQWKFVSISGQLWVTNNTNQCIRVHLHQTSKSTLAILFIGNNSIAWKWVATQFWSDSIVFNENRIASIIAELSQRWHWH